MKQGALQNANLGDVNRGAKWATYQHFLDNFEAKNVKLTQPVPAVVVISLDGSQSINQLDLGEIRDLKRAVEIVQTHAQSGRVRFLVIRSEIPQIFCPGFSMAERQAAVDHARAKLVAQELKSVISDIVNLPCLTYCAIDGFSLGCGAELAMACDIRYINEDQNGMSMNELRWGYMPMGGATSLLPYIVGQSNAKEMIYSAKIAKPAELASMGLGGLLNDKTFKETKHGLMIDVKGTQDDHLKSLELAHVTILREIAAINSHKELSVLPILKKTVNNMRGREAVDALKIEQRDIGAYDKSMLESDRYKAVMNVKEALMTTYTEGGLSGMRLESRGGGKTEEQQTITLEYLRNKREAASRIGGRGYEYSRKDSVKVSSVNAYEVVVDDFKFRKTLWDSLYPFQREGIEFLYNSCEKFEGAQGALLADDMGIGKSLQVIAYLDAVYFNKMGAKFLLVLPKTLAATWIQEISKWIGMGFNFFPVYDASSVNKIEKQKRIWRTQKKDKGGLVVCTYGAISANPQLFLSQNSEEVEFDAFGNLVHLPDDEYKYEWDYVICDEGHIVRNEGNKTAKGLDALGTISRRRVILTGTPFQNSLKEYWRLFDFIANGKLLGPYSDFMDQWGNNIECGRLIDSTALQVRDGSTASEHLNALIEPYYLRRLKSEVFKDGWGERLVFKSDLAIWIKPTATQIKYYLKCVELAKENALQAAKAGIERRERIKKLRLKQRQLNKRKKIDRSRTMVEDETGDVDLYDLRNKSEFRLDLVEEGKETEEDYRAKAMSVFVFQQLSNHPQIVSDYNKKVLNIEEMTNMRQLWNYSSKLQVLTHLLDLNLEHKTLVFCRSVEYLDIIDRFIRYYREQKGITQDFLRFDGGTAAAKRQNYVNEFNRCEPEKYNMMLMTTQVGGYGLTVTGANRVILVDPSWNPAEDQQAIDRVFRIGQEDDVIIYRLITCGTIEETMFKRQVFKQSIGTQTVQTDKNVEVERYFSLEEVYENSKVATEFEKSTTCDEIGKLVGMKVDEFAPDGLESHLDAVNKHKYIYGHSFCERLFRKSQQDANKRKEDDRLSQKKELF